MLFGRILKKKIQIDCDIHEVSMGFNSTKQVGRELCHPIDIFIGLQYKELAYELLEKH